MYYYGGLSGRGRRLGEGALIGELLRLLLIKEIVHIISI